MGRIRLTAIPLAILVMAAASLASALGASALHADAALLGGDGQPVGWARFVEDGTGRLHVSVHVTGMTPGLHGTHIHAVGSCEPSAFTSAGGHHNPLGVGHGLDSADGGHSGDLPNLIVTPHNAWASKQAMQTLADQLVDNLEAFVRGEPQNLVI